MNPNLKCDICGRPARHHQTTIEGQDAVVQHLCGLHARQPSLCGFKDVLITQVNKFPEDWLTSQGTEAERRQQVAEAGSLRELAEWLRMDEIAKTFPPHPPKLG